MEAKKNIMTAEKKKMLEDEYYDIKNVRMKENSEKIKEARAQGDLSENAEYDAAKDEQAELAGRMAEIEAILKNAEVVDLSELDTDSINMGSTVKILDIEEDEEMTYRLTGSLEANSEEGTLSIDSPLGAALMKAKTGDIVTVEAPVGELKFKVLDFQPGNLGE
ncbi:transcription elongation factor GreA [Lachnospiraceae bacterium YH-ros2228]|jgi:transcription elongation factor GreA|nr:transcription elongation factor GreA [Lachnospiraceae bacterium]MDD6351795.1 transcription elongation factor GreA [Lachnospiraceae bacterium]MDD6450204.1 transcription elongation factor GreA [Lachnospiraceae bacterium]MDD6450363.1 transcription elongation factor GreA [Lachnospiraceae bacterium]MDD6578907.1 transcription elongation factor GreA [Lachnospiraceae bacterium]